MKNSIDEANIKIIYKNDMESRNKLIEFIINLILDINISKFGDLSSDFKTSNSKGDYQSNDN